jgi:hypothetical protein
MNCVEELEQFGVELKGVCLKKGKRIVRLGINIYADYVKPSFNIPFASSPGTAEEVKK